LYDKVYEIQLTTRPNHLYHAHAPQLNHVTQYIQHG